MSHRVFLPLVFLPSSDYGIRKELLGEVLKMREEAGTDDQALYWKGTIPIGNPTDPEALQTIKESLWPRKPTPL